MGPTLTTLALAAGFVLTAAALIWVLQQRRSPQSALAWILLIVTVPFLGVPLFFALGVRKRGTRYAPIRFTDMAPSPEPSTSTGPPVHTLDDMFRRFDLPAAQPGHWLTLETDPDAARAALDRLVDGATDRLDVALYRLDPDPVSEAFLSALTEAAREGLRVRLLLDQMGTLIQRPRPALKAFAEAGGELRLFSPFPQLLSTGRLNLRNHRKMVIADGAEVWSGGRNVGHSYLGPARDPATWTDLSFTLQGPMVRRFAEVFEADWQKEGEAAPAPLQPTPAVPTGATTAQLVPSGPDLPHDALHDGLVHAIHAAEARIWIATPYFLPSDQLLHALATAARLGRDVRLLLPARSNQRIADFARGTYVRDLEAAGARILRAGPRMLHAKAVVLDRAAILGSANLDVRSMLLNFETALVVYDAETVGQVAAWFTEVASSAKEGTVPATLPRRLAEATFRLGAPIL